MEDEDNGLVAENNLDCTAKWPDHTRAVEAPGCNLAVDVLVEGDAVLVGRTWSTCGYWSTQTFGELLVESSRESHGNDCGSTDNKHNRSKPRRK